MEQKPAVICFLFNLFLLRNFLDSSCRDVMKWGCWRTVHRESCSAQQEEIYYIMLCKGLAVFIWVDCPFFVCFLLSSSIKSPKHCLSWANFLLRRRRSPMRLWTNASGRPRRTSTGRRVTWRWSSPSWRRRWAASRWSTPWCHCWMAWWRNSAPWRGRWGWQTYTLTQHFLLLTTYKKWTLPYVQTQFGEFYAN